jgi:hypothetical protein
LYVSRRAGQFFQVLLERSHQPPGGFEVHIPPAVFSASHGKLSAVEIADWMNAQRVPPRSKF